MENISTGLKWVIGIIVTILIVAAGVSIYLVINNYFIRAQEQTLAQTQMINQAEFNSYDNKDVSGQDVINAAMRYKGRPQFSIKIITGENTKGFYAENTYKSYYEQPAAVGGLVDISKPDVGDPQSVSEMLDITNKDNCTVNTLGRFNSTIYRDQNDEVRLIVFSQNK